MNRRSLFRIVGAGVLASKTYGQHEHGENPKQGLASDLYKPRFFSQEAYRTIQHMCDVLLPTDQDSPGAREAGVPFFLDTILLYSSEAAQRQWTQGVAAVDRLSKELNGEVFESAGDAGRDLVFDRLALHEGSPMNDLETFFAAFKLKAIEGYCYSEIGMHRYLGYKGETALKAFPGCSEPTASEPGK